jgi:hypothetical protein
MKGRDSIGRMDHACDWIGLYFLGIWGQFGCFSSLLHAVPLCPTKNMDGGCDQLCRIVRLLSVLHSLQMAPACFDGCSFRLDGAHDFVAGKSGPE